MNNIATRIIVGVGVYVACRLVGDFIVDKVIEQQLNKMKTKAVVKDASKNR